jgi:general secretion pathway protein D
VKASRNAQRDSIETYTGAYAPTSDIYITRIIHLKHISAEEVNKRLRVLPSKDGEMTPYEPTNSLLITDYGANVERMVKIIKELDRPGFEEQLSVIPIRYAKSKDLADLINQIINKDPRGGGGGAPAFGANVPRFRSRGGTAAGGTPEELSLVAPDDRTNALIVVGNRAGIEKVRDLVKKLDYKLDPSRSRRRVCLLRALWRGRKNCANDRRPRKWIVVIRRRWLEPARRRCELGHSVQCRTANASPLDRQNIFGGDVKINADKNTNSLVITASKQDYDTVRSLSRQNRHPARSGFCRDDHHGNERQQDALLEPDLLLPRSRIEGRWPRWLLERRIACQHPQPRQRQRRGARISAAAPPSTSRFPAHRPS